MRDDPQGAAPSVPAGEDLVRFAALVDLSRDFIAMALPDGTVTYVNPAGREMVGLGSLEDAVARSTDDYFCDVGRETSHAIEDAVRTQGHWEGESLLRHFPSGEAIPVSVSSFLVTHPGTGEPLVLATVQRDLRPQKEIEHRLREALARVERSDAEQRAIATLGQVALDATLGDLLDATAAQVASALGEGAWAAVHEVRDDGTAWTALAVSDVARLPPGSPASPAGPADPPDPSDLPTPAALEAWRSGRPVVVAGVSAVPVPGADGPWGVLAAVDPRPGADGEERLAFLRAGAGVLSSALRRLAVENTLRHQTLHDPLTRLPNRILAADRLERALERSARSGTLTAVLLVDLDDFKTVNDSLGHEVGDALLVAVGRRLRSAVRPEDTVARLGGDEFVLVCADLLAELEALALAERVSRVFAEAVDVGGVPLHVVGSVGLTFVGGDSAQPVAEAHEVLRQADMAMYRAKERRLGGFEVFDDRMRRAALRRLAIATALRADLAEGRLTLAYQPIVDVATGRVAAVEALARWGDSDPGDGTGPVGPAEFVEVAERTGLIGRLGEWALREACAAAAGWGDDRAPGVRVNVSPLQLRDEAFAGTVDSVLRQTGLAPGRLGLELTEAAIIDDTAATRATIERLHALGVQLLLDDFGTGYSALSYLHRFPQIGCLKIDRTFVAGMRARRSDEAIVTAVLAMAGEFGLDVVAEGVEEPEQLQRLRDLGCTYAQGFLLGRPVPPHELAVRLAAGVA